MRRANKYGNEECIAFGEAFDSRREARRYGELLILQKAGRISELRRQVSFELLPVQRAPSTQVYKKGPHKGEPKPGYVIEQAVKYIADFVYEQNGVTVVEDAKGKRTKDYIIKRKLMLYIHGIKIREV